MQGWVGLVVTRTNDNCRKQSLIPVQKFTVINTITTATTAPRKFSTDVSKYNHTMKTREFFNTHSFIHQVTADIKVKENRNA